MKQAVATPAPTLSDSSETMTTQTSLPCSTNNPGPGAPTCRWPAIPASATPPKPTPCRWWPPSCRPPAAISPSSSPMATSPLLSRCWACAPGKPVRRRRANGAPAPTSRPTCAAIPSSSWRTRTAASSRCAWTRRPPRWSRAATTVLRRSRRAHRPARALEFCRDYQNQHAYTMEFARALAEADLLVENRADITLPTASAWPCPASK